MRFRDTIGISRSLKQLEQELTYRMDELLREFHITAAQYSALSILEAEGPLNNAELARESRVTAQTMIRITKSLRARNLIRNEKENLNSGKKAFVLTARAEALICKAHHAVNRLETKMTRSLRKTETANLMKALEILLQDLQTSR